MKKNLALMAAFFMAAGIFTRCGSPVDQNQGKKLMQRNIAILNDGSTVAEAVGEALQMEGFKVDLLSAEEVCDQGILSAEDYFLYVIPGTAEYPACGEKALVGFLEGKGNLMVLGTPELPGQPLLETVSPGYKMYPMHEMASLSRVEGQGILEDEKGVLPVPQAASSCFRRPTGKGFTCGYRFRWIPILAAYDQDGLERGTAAWMLINEAPLDQDPVFKDALRRLVATTPGNEAKAQLNLEGSVFAVCAIDDPRVLEELAGTALFGNMAKRISRGLFLSHAGADEFSYWPGELMQLGAAVVNYGGARSSVDVIIRVTSEKDSETVFKKKKKFRVLPGETLKMGFGAIPVDTAAGGYNIRAELAEDGKTIDVIEHEVGLLSLRKEPKDAFISTEQTKFKLLGKDWYPVGANYWPRSAIATEQIDYLYHWLTPGYYDPGQIEDDLQRFQEMGGNFIAIRANYLENRRTLLDFMRRCRNHGIYVYLFLQTHEVTVEPHYFEGLLMPFHFQEKKVADFIKETSMTGNPALFAWDLIWEPSNWLFKDSVYNFGWDGDPNFRARWDGDWEKWITERYGSLAHAEADWVFSVPRAPDGSIASPSNRMFEEDGPWRIMMAAYRRFMGDLMNRQYNDACRILRRLDPNHLLSYRQGNLPPTDYTLTSTMKHVDFFSMEAYSFPPSENGINKVGFVNRYLSHALANKPFMWNEYGYGGPWGKHTRHLDGEDIVYQYEYVEMVNSEAYKNGANGISPWWWAGGMRASEKTDFGITTPEGTLRPSGESLKKYARLYRTKPPERPDPDTWITIDPDAHSGGLWYITNHFGADAYKQAVKSGKCLGVKTSGTGTTSSDTPLLAVGDTRYDGHNPPKYLNAEFNWFKIRTGEGEWTEVSNGGSLKIAANTPVYAMASAGNLQEATWLTPVSCKGKPGAVYLASTGGSALTLKLPIDQDTPWHLDTDFGGEFRLTDGISQKTFVELQLTAEGRAWFGEKIRFELVPGDQ